MSGSENIRTAVKGTVWFKARLTSKPNPVSIMTIPAPAKNDLDMVFSFNV
jgi:hypothetical protein